MRKVLSPAAPQEAGVEKSEIVRAFKRGASEYGLLISLIVIMAFFQVSTNGVLMQPLNLTNLVLGVSSGIPGVRRQAGNRSIFD